LMDIERVTRVDKGPREGNLDLTAYDDTQFRLRTAPSGLYPDSFFTDNFGQLAE
jgi:hypothetical protein